MLRKIRRALLDRPIAQKIARNVVWLAAERIFRLVVALAVAVALARLLGPEKFGILNLALAFAAIFMTFSSFGLAGVVPKDLVRHPDRARRILGSAWAIQVAAAAIFYVLMLMAAYIINPQNLYTIHLIAIIGFSLFFKSSQVITYWFEAKIDSKLVLWSESGVLFLSAAVKIALAWCGAPLVVFALVIAAEAALIAAVAFLVYARSGQSAFAWVPTWNEARRLIADSWPLLISSAAWILYTRMDQIMIGRMVGNEAVGFYTAATRLSDATNILPAILAASIVPAITLLRETDRGLYLRKFQVVYDLVFALSLGLAVTLTLLSTALTAFAYGQEYAASAAVLAIHAWAIVFISMAVVSGRYLVNEGLQRITMVRHILGVILNLFLNYLLIGRYGINGAAVATLISLGVANYLMDALHPATRICFVQKSRSLIFASVWRRSGTTPTAS